MSLSKKLKIFAFCMVVLIYILFSQINKLSKTEYVITQDNKEYIVTMPSVIGNCIVAIEITLCGKLKMEKRL
jgi:hypothetical protein